MEKLPSRGSLKSRALEARAFKLLSAQVEELSLVEVSRSRGVSRGVSSRRAFKSKAPESGFRGVKLRVTLVEGFQAQGLAVKSRFLKSRGVESS